MNIKKLSDKAIIPTKAHDTDAGYDLYTTESYTLKPGERKVFKTDISLAIPPTLYGRIAPRSGLAVKKGIDVLAGVVDSSYRGEVSVVLINLGQESVTIWPEDKIAQIIFEEYSSHEFTLVDELDTTKRNTNGFGSSGK
jgi:dUTP pyrophosphatase